MVLRALRDLDSSQGIVRLIDDDASREHTAKEDIVLVPQPSRDPNDPLRWPAWRKHATFGSLCLFTFLVTFSGTGLSAGFAEIAQYFEVGPNQVSGLLSWNVLALGLSNFFWVPTAIYFGKRPSFLVACSVLLACNIWAACSTSFASLLGAQIVTGMAGGSTEALATAVINDLYFLHERGSKMGYYIVAISWGSCIGPLVGGPIISGIGWRWQKWISAMLTGANLLLLIFFAPETRFSRGYHVDGLRPDGQISGGSVGVARVDGRKDEATKIDSEAGSCYSGNATLPERKSYGQLLRPWSGSLEGSSWWKLALRPFPLVCYPAVLYAVIVYSVALAPTVMISIQASFILEAPPYSFAPALVGLYNIPGIVGNLAGAILGGIVADKHVEWRARGNRGVFLPRYRLEPLLPSAVLVAVGIFVFGSGVARGWHWAVLFVMYGLVSVGLTGLAGLVMTFVMDGHWAVAPECLTLINGLKNVVAFGFVYAAVPWVQSQGYQAAYAQFGAIFVFFMLLAVPLALAQSRIRAVTDAWRVITW